MLFIGDTFPDARYTFSKKTSKFKLQMIYFLLDIYQGYTYSFIAKLSANIEKKFCTNANNIIFLAGWTCPSWTLGQLFVCNKSYFSQVTGNTASHVQYCQSCAILPVM